ncbi:hypothetical protein HJC23_003446 [Cyclotella cryptica]|uniref:Uncharacterized protein n=1 Tax=Cyclotella cryptica TaxID=29204 RepID=A0ABD3QVW8_9STRA
MSEHTKRTNAHHLEFIHTSKAQEAGHTLSITSKGKAYSYCHNSKTCDNELGQLGRTGNTSIPLPVILPEDGVPRYAYTGGFPSSGHSAILDSTGHLWVSGCDRWQQLGLGSSDGGSTGYTWKGGRLWQTQFQKNLYVIDFLKRLDPSLYARDCVDAPKKWIRDVALGGDHTLILSHNKRDVIAFGKGGEGQLGLSSKPWVSSPSKSKVLSSSNADVAAVCAYRNCSFTLDDCGRVKDTAGKCSFEVKGLQRAVDLCRKRARADGMISNESLQSSDE